MSDTKLIPYLTLNGTTREAMEFYAKVLGGKLQLQTFAEVPDMEIAAEDKDRIMHAYLDAGSLILMASDAMPGTTVKMGENISLSLNGDDHDTLTRVFDQLGEGGKVTMPLAKQFWGDTFGVLTDRFGIQWMVNIDGTDKAA
jgi:PhnB protein